MGILDDYLKRTGKTDEEEVENAGILDRGADLAIDVFSTGVIGLGEAVVGAADIVSAGRAGQLMEDYLGYDPAAAKQILEKGTAGIGPGFSEERQFENIKRAEAFEEGFFPGLKEVISEPAMAIGTVAGAIPQIIAGGGIARGITKVAPALAKFAPAIGEGVISAATMAEGVRQETEGGALTANQLGLIGAAGLGTALFGFGGNRLATKFGIDDIDAFAAGVKRSLTETAAAVGKKSTLLEASKGILKGILSEGVFEELPQSLQETIFQNLATDKPWDEGLSEAAAMGLVSGGIMGGAMGSRTAISNKITASKVNAFNELKKQEAVIKNKIENPEVPVADTDVLPDEAIDVLDEEPVKIVEPTTEPYNQDATTEPISALEDAQTAEEIQTEAKKIEALIAATTEAQSQRDQIEQEADRAIFDVVLDKIIAGERDFTPEELQVQQNNPEAVEAALTQKRIETEQRTDIHADEKEAAMVLDADPTIFRKLFSVAKTSKAFTAELVRRFGTGAKKYAVKLWSLFKRSKLFTDERGEIGLEISLSKDGVDRKTINVFGATEEEYSKGEIRALEKEGNVHAAAERDRRWVNDVYLGFDDYTKPTGAIPVKELIEELEITETAILALEEYTGNGRRLPFLVQVREQIKVLKGNQIESKTAIKDKLIPGPVTVLGQEKTPEEMAQAVEEVTDPTLTEEEARKVRAARDAQIRKENLKGYEEPIKFEKVVPEDFIFTEEDEGFEGDAPFEGKPRRSLSDKEHMQRDILAAAGTTKEDIDRLRAVKTHQDILVERKLHRGNDRAMLVALNKILKDNEEYVEGARKELNNNPEFTVVDDYINPATGELGMSLLDIITNDLETLGSIFYVKSVIDFIKKEEARLQGKETPLKSLSELDSYPESLSEVMSRYDTIENIEDNDFNTYFEEESKIPAMLDPDKVIDFIETEVHNSWEYSDADLKRMIVEFETEFNAVITTKQMSEIINGVRDGVILRNEIETEEYQLLADLDLLKLLDKHTEKTNIRRLIIKEIVHREEQSLKAIKDDNIEGQYEAFKKRAEKKSKIDRHSWIAFYRGIAELASEGVGFQANPLNLDRLRLLVSKRASKEFRDLDFAVQRELVIEMLQNSFINDGFFNHKFYREDVISEPVGKTRFSVEIKQPNGKTINLVLSEKELASRNKETIIGTPVPVGSIEGVTTQYVSEIVDTQYETTQLGQAIETDFVDRSADYKSKHRTVRILESISLWNASYTSNTGKKIKTRVTTAQLEDLLDENENVEFSRIGNRGEKFDVLQDWTHPDDIINIIKIAQDRNILNTAAAMNKKSAKEYLVDLMSMHKEIFEQKEYENSDEMKRQVRLLNALAAEQLYDNQSAAEKDPKFFEKLAKEKPELGLSPAELYEEYLKSGSDPMIFNARITRKRNPDLSHNQIDLERAPTPAVDAFHESSFMQKTDFELDLISQEARRKIDFIGPTRVTHDTMKTGRLKNPLAQKFYGLVAKTFGADLVVISDDTYGSRYIGKANDGRSKIVINLKSSNHFAGIFAHELFHHVVNKAAPAEYQAFRSNIKDMVKAESWERAVSEEMKAREINRSEAEEEVLADLFRHVLTTREFYQRLAETPPGSTLAGKLISRLVGHAGQIAGLINREEGGWWHNVNPRSGTAAVIGNNDMGPVYDLVRSLVTTVSRHAPVNHNETRFLIPMGGATVNEIKGWLDYPAGWLKGAWTAVFKPGTKNYKDLMSNIEEILKGSLQLVKKYGTKYMISDFLADPIQTAIMNKIVFQPGSRVKKIRNQVANKHKAAFDGMTDIEMENMHDVFVRDPNEESIEDQAELDLVISKIEAIEKAYPEIKDGVVDNVNDKTQAEYLKLQQQASDLEGTIINGIDVGTKKEPNVEGIAKAKKLGYSDEIIAAYQDFQKVSREIYGRLKDIYPDLKYRPTHYGQSIRWRRKGGVPVNDEFDWAIPSKLKGSEYFLEEKSLESTAKIKTRNLIYDSIKPHELLLSYVQETEKIIALHEGLKKAGTTIQTESKADPVARIFTTEAEARKAGYYSVGDEALKIFAQLDIGMGEKIKMADGSFYSEDGIEVIFIDKNAANDRIANAPDIFIGATIVSVDADATKTTAGYEVIHKESGTVISSVTAQTEAYRVLKVVNPMGHDGFEVKAIQGAAETAQVGQIYLAKDMARMMKNYLAKDHIRSSAVGNTLMNIKNHMTSLEFALSMFHAMTIGQELVASYLAWGYSKLRRGELKFERGNLRALNKSKKLVLLAEQAVTTPEIKDDPAFQAEVDSLLGTKGTEILDLVERYNLVGGSLHQDTSLRSSAYKLGEARYRLTPQTVEIKDGKVVYTGAEGIKVITEGMKASIDSMVDVFKDQINNNPDKKIKALANTFRFGMFQQSSAWLMEEMIPRVKMAMWMREYTLKVQKFQKEIDSGEMLKEEIAHQTMKFIEDRFGEVNWQNQWMDPTVKTFLQFSFRSFTWVTGSWKALGKAGIDMAKLGWFTVKGEKYELTEKGQWGMAAVFAHIATVAMIKGLYVAVLGLSGADEAPDDEETPLLTELLFPRSDFSDPRQRLTVPSYITEGFKIGRHTGMIGNEVELHKLISGRLSSIIGNTLEAMQGEDWRGVSIRDPKDNFLEQAFDTMTHIFITPPISVSSAMKNIRERGLSPSIGISFLGMTDAPAAAKRTDATNKAFELARSEFKGTETTEEEIELRDDVRRAMYKYGQGDKSEINKMRRKGLLSIRQFKNALSKLPRISGKRNPAFIPELQRALKRLTIDSAIETWGYMTETEKKKYRPQIMKKYSNMMKRQDKSRKKKKEIREKMKEAGIFK